PRDPPECPPVTSPSTTRRPTGDGPASTGSRWGGTLLSGTQVAVIPAASGELDLFARWNDDSVRHARQSAAPTGWSGWEALGGALPATRRRASTPTGGWRSSPGARTRRWCTAGSLGVRERRAGSRPRARLVVPHRMTAATVSPTRPPPGAGM